MINVTKHFPVGNHCCFVICNLFCTANMLNNFLHMLVIMKITTMFCINTTKNVKKSKERKEDQKSKRKLFACQIVKHVSKIFTFLFLILYVCAYQGGSNVDLIICLFKLRFIQKNIISKFNLISPAERQTFLVGTNVLI